MTSAALDACLCLLLISGAAVTVTSISQPSDESTADRADAVAETVAAETATVAYTLRPVDGDTAAAGPAYDRTAHGTLASLLAKAAVRTVHIDGNPLTKTSAGFADAVRNVVRERLPARTQVVVEFHPYPGSHTGRELAVGPTPPATVDVHAATIRAPSGISPVGDSLPDTASRGFNDLGDAVAAAVVEGIFPPEKGRLALAGDPPVDRLVEHRYSRASARYGVETQKAIARGDIATANQRLAEAMGDRVASEFRKRFTAPRAAADSLQLESVTIKVRTWSA